MAKRVTREVKETKEKSMVAKAATAVVSRRVSSETSSDARKKVWELMMNPKTSSMTVSDLAERIGLQPSAIAFAVKYFKQITSFLKEKGKMR